MFTTDIHLETAQEYTLQEAVLVYGSGSGCAFATRHAVVAAETPAGAPSLGAGRLVSSRFLRTLARDAARGDARVEFLPPSVLVSQPGLLLWWTPPMRRTLRFADHNGPFSQLDNHEVALPGLVWRVRDGGALAVRAVAGRSRPQPHTALAVAPMWNIYPSGSVCVGTMRKPNGDIAAVVTGWVESFFNSYFTHPNANRGTLTRHPDDFFGLWLAARAPKPFRDRWLVPLTETLTDFATASDD